MSTRFNRRRMLAGMAALPALALLGCEYDRTTANPVNTVGTLDFGNRLRIPAMAASSIAEEKCPRVPAERDRRNGRIPPRHGNADLVLYR